MNFITNYPHMCDKCNAAIGQAAEVLHTVGEDTADPEAPLLFASDHMLLCGGNTCKGDFEAGDLVEYYSPRYGEVTMLLTGFDGHFWQGVACGVQGDLYADPDELVKVTQ